MTPQEVRAKRKTIREQMDALKKQLEHLQVDCPHRNIQNGEHYPAGRGTPDVCKDCGKVL